VGVAHIERIHAGFIVIGLGASILGAGARADTFVSKQDGSWNELSTWCQNGGAAVRVPDASGDDIAIIQHTVEVDRANSVMWFIISSEGTLRIVTKASLSMGGLTPGGQIDGTLEIYGGNFIVDSPALVTVSPFGVILMDGGDPALTVNAMEGIILDSYGLSAIFVDPAPDSGPDAVISGTGSILSPSEDNEIVINLTHSSQDIELRLDGAMLEGAMRIRKGGGGNALFDNRGIVRAEDTGSIPGSLVLDSSLHSITDTAASSCTNPRWRASSSGWLQFGRSATGLASAFGVSGTLGVAWGATVTTSGGLVVGTHAAIVGTFNYNHATCSGVLPPDSDEDVPCDDCP
jgi:hypothetical protein